MAVSNVRKRLWWMGDSRECLRGFPEDVRWEIGGAIDAAECGEMHSSAKPMRGINAVEIVSDFDGDTFRGVYTTKFKDNVYVLHCFEKKSKKSRETPRRDINLIEKRLKEAEKHHRLIQDRGGRGKKD